MTMFGYEDLPFLRVSLKFEMNVGVFPYPPDHHKVYHMQMNIY